MVGSQCETVWVATPRSRARRAWLRPRRLRVRWRSEPFFIFFWDGADSTYPGSAFRLVCGSLAGFAEQVRYSDGPDKPQISPMQENVSTPCMGQLATSVSIMRRKKSRL